MGEKFQKINSAAVLFILVLLLTACSSNSTGTTWQEQYDLGMQYLTEGDYEAAILAFTAAIEIDSKDIQAYTGLTQAYIGMNDYESAAVTTGQGAEAIKDTGQVQVDGAVDEFTATLLTLAELCLDEGNYESAETIYSLIIGINEDCVDAYVARPEIYIILGEREKALEDYRKVLELLQQGEIGCITEDEIERLINELDSIDETSASDGEDGRTEFLLEEMYMVMDGVSTLRQRYTYSEDGSVSTYYECDSDSTYSMYEVYTYDESNFLLSSFAEHYRNGSAIYQESKTYNDGRLINQEYKYPSDVSLGSFIEYTYDESGNLIKEMWSGLETRILEYKYENGLLAETCINSGYNNASTIYYTYDDNGNLISQLDVGENDSSHVLFEYTYDEDGNVLTESESMDIGKYSITKDWQKVYVYNGNGQLIEEYVYMYGETEQEVTSTSVTEYTYEDEKLLREVTYIYRSDGTLYDNGVNYTEYTYDENGNLIASVYLDSERAELYKYEYTYVMFSVDD